MMAARFPRSIKIGHLVYKIACVSRAEIMLQPGVPYECDGYTSHERQHIWVASDLGLEQRQETLMHEIEHCVVHVAFPLETAWLKRHEEQYVSRTAGPRMQAFRDNHVVRRYLFEKG
jgi:hypothetical protein